jgi:hypothetical protein
VEPDNGRISFPWGGVFYIFVSATNEIQIQENPRSPNPDKPIQDLRKTTNDPSPKKNPSNPNPTNSKHPNPRKTPDPNPGKNRSPHPEKPIES